MVLQYYQNLKEMTSNTFHIVEFVVGFKCPRKIQLNTQWGGQFYDMRVKAIVQPYSILGSAHGVKKYDFFIKEDEQMTGIS